MAYYGYGYAPAIAPTPAAADLAALGSARLSSELQQARSATKRHTHYHTVLISGQSERRGRQHRAQRAW